jgi:hypothetical protein
VLNVLRVPAPGVRAVLSQNAEDVVDAPPWVVSRAATPATCGVAIEVPGNNGGSAQTGTEKRPGSHLQE